MAIYVQFMCNIMKTVQKNEKTKERWINNSEEKCIYQLWMY